MNFKIENNYLDITNYPRVEKYFEEMASRGWLITKILMGNLFIYRKIEPEDLNFSISPYEIETAFTIKSKEEIEEFQSVCEFVGWNYALEVSNLHVYFKKTETQAVDISTDEEEEFNTLESLGKRQLTSSYIIIPFYLYLAWSILGGAFTDIQFMQDGMVQILAPIIPIFFISVAYQIRRIKKFLKINKNNIDIGKPLEYVESKFLFEKATFGIYLLFLILFIAYSFYSAFILKNKVILIAFVPLLIGTTIVIFYRIFIKPSKKTVKYKKILLAIALIISTIASINITFLSINTLAMKENSPDIVGYKVLSANDFSDKVLGNEGDLIRNASFLTPVSYSYWSWTEGNSSVMIEYSNVLTEGLAKNLVKRYIKQAEKGIADSISWRIDILIEEDIYDYSLEMNGISEEEFDSLKIKDIKEAEKEFIAIAKEKSISRDKENLWNVDELYFLNYQKNEILIRDRKEAFYLEGQDFTDPEVIGIVKDRLNL